MTKSNTEYSKEYRARIKAEGKKEIRGIMSYPELEIKIKLDAQTLTDAHEKVRGESK